MKNCITPSFPRVTIQADSICKLYFVIANINLKELISLLCLFENSKTESSTLDNFYFILFLRITMLLGQNEVYECLKLSLDEMY